MSELKILHAADLHLDSPFEGLGAGKAAQRREEQRRLLYRIAQLAQTERVDLVLLAGDLLDSDSTYAETAGALAEALGGISVPVYTVAGITTAQAPSTTMRTFPLSAAVTEGSVLPPPPCTLISATPFVTVAAVPLTLIPVMAFFVNPLASMLVSVGIVVAVVR